MRVTIKKVKFLNFRIKPTLQMRKTHLWSLIRKICTHFTFVLSQNLWKILWNQLNFRFSAGLQFLEIPEINSFLFFSVFLFFVFRPISGKKLIERKRNEKKKMWFIEINFIFLVKFLSFSFLSISLMRDSREREKKNC